MLLRSPAARLGFSAGLRAALPMAVATFPLGLAYGVAVTATGVDRWVGASASWTVLAAAAQLTMLSLMERQASWLVVVVAALVINLRFALYSVALAPGFMDFPPRWRFSLPYLMTDQTAALSLYYFAGQRDPIARRWYFLATGLGIAAFWWAGTVAGVTAGGIVPRDIDIAFAVPLVFVVLVVPAVVDLPAAVASAVALVITLAAASLPHGLNIIIGAGAGVAAGAMVDRWRG